MPSPNISLWTSPKAGKLVAVFAWISAGAFFATVVAAICAWQWSSLGLIVSLAASWAIAPPIYFWYEYHYIYRRLEPDTSYFEQFKYGQQVSIAIWAGVAITLGAIASSDHFKPKEPPPPATQTQAKQP